MSERTVQRVGAKVVVRSIDNAGCTMRALTVTSGLRLQGSALAAALARPDVLSALTASAGAPAPGTSPACRSSAASPARADRAAGSRRRRAGRGEVVWQGSDGALDQNLEEFMPDGPQRARLDWNDLARFAPEVDDPRTVPLPADRATLRRPGRVSSRRGGFRPPLSAAPSRASSSSATKASASEDRQGPRHRGVDRLALRPQLRGGRPMTKRSSPPPRRPVGRADRRRHQRPPADTHQPRGRAALFTHPPSRLTSRPGGASANQPKLRRRPPTLLAPEGADNRKTAIGAPSKAGTKRSPADRSIRSSITDRDQARGARPGTPSRRGTRRPRLRVPHRRPSVPAIISPRSSPPAAHPRVQRPTDERPTRR